MQPVVVQSQEALLLRLIKEQEEETKYELSNIDTLHPV